MASGLCVHRAQALPFASAARSPDARRWREKAELKGSRAPRDGCRTAGVGRRSVMSRLLLVPVCKRALPICSQSSTNGHSTNGMQTGHPVCFQCVFSARLHSSLAWSKRALRPDTNGKFPFVLRASFVPTSFFANGLPVCSRRVARTPPKVTAPVASVGSALRLREWESGCSFLPRGDVVVAQDQTGSAHLRRGCKWARSRLRRDTVTLVHKRAPRILSLSPSIHDVGPSKARSFTESRVGAQTGHDCKAPWCACANGHSALTATFIIATFTYANGHFGVNWQKVRVCKRALGTNGT